MKTQYPNSPISKSRYPNILISLIRDKQGKISQLKLGTIGLMNDGLGFPNSKVRDNLEVFIVSSEINEVKIIHSKQMECVVRQQAIMLQPRQIFNDNMLGRFYNA